MDHHGAFLQAIIETPDDDTPRLIYADWLDEHGDAARGEFIRVQCALADRKTDPNRLPPLQVREQDLLAQHRKEWEEPFQDLGVQKVAFRRGFAQTVSMNITDFLTHAGELFTVAPIRGLDLKMSEIGDDTEQLETVRQLAHCSHLTHLTSLDLSSNDITDAGVHDLAQCPHLSHLTSLNLGGNNFGDAGVLALTRSPSLSRLTSLNLDQTGIRDVVAEALAMSPTLTQLTSLRLRFNGIGPEGARALVRSLPHLTSLDLGGNVVGDAVLSEIQSRLASRKASRTLIT